MTIWAMAVEKILEPVAKTLRRYVYRSARHRLLKKFSVEEIGQALQGKRLSFDTAFRIEGTFSEFVPFVDFATLVTSDVRSNATGTCRLGDIVKRGKYIAALFPPEAGKATEPAIPIVYSTAPRSRKMFSFSTGDQVDLECQLIPLDYGFRGILHRGETFCFEGKPFGLEIHDVYTKKPKKVDKFVIDSFFLSSLEYEGGIDRFFSLLDDIANIIYAGRKSLFPITTTSLILYELHRMGKVTRFMTHTEDIMNPEESTSVDCIEGKLYRFSNPVNIIDKTGAQKVLDNMKETINHFSFIEGGEVRSFEEWQVLRALFDFKFTSWERKFLSKFKELEPITRKLHGRPDLCKAWDFYANPHLSIDFQFDQVCPSLKQKINLRKLLERSGLA
jgi:hypothetical protein